jgi:glycosyltransferase involved in cell wall biosynthesis
MAVGVPVVQPRRGSFPEVVEETGGGVLAKSDDAAGLADAIYDLWKTPGLAADLGSKGAQNVREHYSVACMAGRATEVYQAIAAEHTRR